MAIYGNGLDTAEAMAEAGRQHDALWRRASVQMDLNGAIQPRLAAELRHAQIILQEAIKAHQAACAAAERLAGTD